MNAKKLSAVLAAILLPTLAAASDIKPGAIEVSGRSMLDLSSGSQETKRAETGLPTVATDKHDISKVGLEAGALYYLTRNVGVGLVLGYERTKDKDKLNAVTLTDSLLTIGPKVGVDFGIAEKLSVFGDADLVYATGNHKEQDPTAPTVTWDVSGFGFGLAAGLKYFPLAALSIDVGVDYRYLKVKGDVTPLIQDTTTKSGVGGFAGLSFYFGN